MRDRAARRERVVNGTRPIRQPSYPAEALTMIPQGTMIPTSPREFLDLMDAYFADPKIPLEERRALWDVLTSTRGPDRPKDRKKVGHGVTAILRAHAFPRTAAMLVKGASKGFKPKMDPKGSLAKAAERLHDGAGHFHTHAWRAILALTRR